MSSYYTVHKHNRLMKTFSFEVVPTRTSFTETTIEIQTNIEQLFYPTLRRLHQQSSLQTLDLMANPFIQ